MASSSLYSEGARLPEQLARLLFILPLVEGRRVMEVGARSDAMANFLLDHGAARVVCAVDDEVTLARLRQQPAREDVDFRLIRPGVLPGDDGAFDLIVDFTLAQALHERETYRVTEIARLLNDDGFALTSVNNAKVPGFRRLFGGTAQAPEVPYRTMVDALKLQFDLVQVYFQSCLSGYLFGAFDVEPSGDGVSPDTTLMSGPEPASHYVFAFGPTIPVIEDVSLVQIPFHALGDAAGLPGDAIRALAPPVALPTLATPAGLTSPPTPVPFVSAEASARAQAAGAADGLDEDGLRALVEGLALRARADAATIAALRSQLAGGAPSGERERLIDAIALLEGECVEQRTRREEALGALALASDRADELEAALLATDAARLETVRMLERAREENHALRAELHRVEQRPAVDAASEAHQLAQLRQALDEARESAIVAHHELAVLRDERRRRDTTPPSEPSPDASLASAQEENARLQERVQQLESEALKLAHGVKTLVQERDGRPAPDDVTRLETRLRAAQQAAEVAKREHASAQMTLNDLVLQRDTLVAALGAREQELAGVREKLREANAELARVQLRGPGRDAGDARVELLESLLAEAQVALSQESARVGVLGAALVEAQHVLAVERGRGELLRAALLEAQGELFAVVRGVSGEVVALGRATEGAPQASLLDATLREAQDRLGEVSARATLLSAQLEEAQALLEDVHAQKSLTEAQLREAQAAFAARGTSH